MSQEAIVVESLQKSFPNEIVLQDIDLDVEEGEFCVIVGPSGCGKSTLLKCIAGLMDFDAGSITLHGTDAEQLSVQERDIGYVFQEFEETLFPHRTVGQNVAFGLEQKGMEAAAIDRKTTEMLDLLAITETRENYPNELSGGQKQRVELARQLVRECDLMLLDDPLADLDYKLQKRMELEMHHIHDSLGSTFVYVTHNQDQALKLADKLVVMNAGMIEQIGTPREVYERPKTAFVGRFIGDSTAFVGDLIGADDGYVEVESALGTMVASRAGDRDSAAADGLVLIRPENITVGDDARRKDNVITASLRGSTYTGETTEYLFSVENVDSDIHVVEPGKPTIRAGSAPIQLGWDVGDAMYHDRLSVTDTISYEELLEV